ncbi:MAG: hypothetical protein H6555_01140 [Lewinellaceae bacterium]|nr:hypothetical protein [Lewinellaceae bacterium]
MIIPERSRWFPVLILLLVGGLLGLSAPENRSNSQIEVIPQSATPLDGMQAFDQVMQVLTHKRCVNCHPAGDRPRQGEDSHYHNFGVQRGKGNHGVAALTCNTCHQAENNNYAGVPGAPDWSLAPRSMAWEGLSRVEIAQSILDPARNGGRTLAQTVSHLTEHELVLWAWDPGVDANGIPREKPPVSKVDFIKAVRAWAAAGAPIPAK